MVPSADDTGRTAPDGSVNVVDPRSDGGATVGGVLLAAGESSRFERGNKLLATLDGVPIVRSAAQTLAESRLADFVVITGHQADAVADALSSLDVRIRHNPEYADGQSTSVHEGVAAARDAGWDAVVFALGDMPAVSPCSVDKLLDAYAGGEGTILAAAYEGKRGNPVLFDAVHYEALLGIQGDQGGRRLIQTTDDAALVETDDPGVTRDVDYEADLSVFEARD
jgi:molybdenum cofactor cytidylyltransferase